MRAILDEERAPLLPHHSDEIARADEPRGFGLAAARGLPDGARGTLGDVPEKVLPRCRDKQVRAIGRERGGRVTREGELALDGRRLEIERANPALRVAVDQMPSIRGRDDRGGMARGVHRDAFLSRVAARAVERPERAGLIHGEDGGTVRRERDSRDSALDRPRPTHLP